MLSRISICLILFKINTIPLCIRLRIRGAVAHLFFYLPISITFWSPGHAGPVVHIQLRSRISKREREYRIMKHTGGALIIIMQQTSYRGEEQRLKKCPKLLNRLQFLMMCVKSAPASATHFNSTLRERANDDNTDGRDDFSVEKFAPLCRPEAAQFSSTRNSSACASLPVQYQPRWCCRFFVCV